MTELHDACKSGDLRKVTSLLSNKGWDINALNTDGESPLHIVCEYGHLEIVKVFLKVKKCNLDIQNSYGNTPLHVACYTKSLDIIRLLFEKRCSTNILNKKGKTAQYIPLNEDGDCLLHIACQWDDVDIVKYLITDERCNLNIQNSLLNTPLHVACYGIKRSIIKHLLKMKCSTNIPNKKGETAQDIPLNEDGDCLLHIACQWGDMDIVTYLITDERCNLNIQNSLLNTPLHVACYGIKRSIIKHLLKMKCSTNIPNKKGETAQDIPLNEDGDCLLHIACQWGDMDIVTYLITDERCDLNIQNSLLNTPLHVACYGIKLDIIKLLLVMRCSTNIPNKKGETAQDIPLNEDGDFLLHIACQWSDVDIVRYLIIDERCNPNFHSSTSENTPLHIAARNGQHSAISQLLLCKQCSPNAQNKEGDTPLHIAARRNKTVAISELLAHQHCNPNVQNNVGDTPLHSLVKSDVPLHNALVKNRQKRAATVSQLLAHQQCDPNVRNNMGDTPLHIAVKNITSMISQLLANEQCNPNILNKDGDTPLHIAVKENRTSMISQLLANEQCNPNVKNMNGDTPLHIACWRQSLHIINHLLERKCSTNIPNTKGETAQYIPLNEDGDCLLHIACQWGDVGLVRYLITDEKYNPNVQSYTSENTPLHIAAKYGQDDTIVQLLSYRECDPNARNKEGDTPLHLAARENRTSMISQLLPNEQCNPNILNKDGDTPLHIAVKENRTSMISQLLANEQCNPNIQNKDGDTPLHIGCWRKFFSIIKLLLQNKSSTNIPNKKGKTAQDIPLNEDGDCLLHIACEWGDVDIVKYLVTDERCNLNVQSYTSENTPLHIAAKYGQDVTIAQLLSYRECDPNAQNKEGDTSLHLAARENRKCAISQLLNSKQCNPNVLNHDHLTPLVTAIKHNNPKVAIALLQHSKCDPILCDSHGNTPLHLACIRGQTHPEMVKVAKQLLTSVDPSCVNSAGQTPIELTTNYQLIQAISHMVKCKTKQSVQTYINMFIVGNPETGKSTLVKAICKEATSILWKIVPKQVRRVKNVPLHTAGIIPTTFRSKIFGNTVLYDLAGQVEYYSSHAAVIRSTVISTPPAFIVVVNLSENEEKISQTLRYWWSFIDNHAARSSAPPQVILVGSHADIVKSTGGSVQEKMTQMSALLKKLSASFHFAGQVALDCRDPASRKLQLFCSLVNKSCTALRQTADVDLHCHVLYAFLLDKFKGKAACMVSDVATSIKETSALLPQKLGSLIPLISTLSDIGLLFLVKGGESHESWWVILQKQALLSEMNGVIFAPKSFRQHKDLSWSTGVVPFSKLRNEFPDYNSNMVSEFLTHLEFCFKIEDHQTLVLLKDEATNAEYTSPDVSEEYYFFPALVSVENPLHIWEENDAMCCKCGWFYQCIRSDQFLSTQFLHVLILRLAFIFALQLDPGDCCEDSLFLRRKCSVWKHGIGWLNWVPIETIVEVGLQYQSVIVMMRCPKGKEAECVQLRSQVIQKVLEVKDEHCIAVKMSESFIHPTDVRYPFTNNVEDVKCYSLTGIARMIARKAVNVLDQRGRNPIPVQDLLLFDPCSTDTSSELLRELFSEKHSMDETVRSQVLGTLNSESENTHVHYAYHVPYKIFFYTV